MNGPQVFDVARAPAVCLFGTAWLVHAAGCSGCRAESDRLAMLFAAAVAAGRYDAQGYTVADRRRQRRGPP